VWCVYRSVIEEPNKRSVGSRSLSSLDKKEYIVVPDIDKFTYKIMVFFWDVATCSLIDTYHQFGEKKYLYFHVNFAKYLYLSTKIHGSFSEDCNPDTHCP
jgi:hypothetical protein